jgi:hypothetical protein
MIAIFPPPVPVFLGCLAYVVQALDLAGASLARDGDVKAQSFTSPIKREGISAILFLFYQLQPQY